MGTLNELPSLHNHRLNHNPSKLPSYRQSDLLPGPLLPAQAPVRLEHEPPPSALEPAHNNATSTPKDQDHDEQINVQHQNQHQHSRNHSESAAASTTNSPARSSLPLAHRPLTFPGFSTSNSTSPLLDYSPSSQPAFAKPKGRGVPASHSRNGLRDSWKGPPPAMLTQRHSDNTSDWVAEQSAIPPPISMPTTTIGKSPVDSAQPQPSKPPVTPLIPPIRAFRSSRRSAEMNATSVRRSSMDQESQDETLRALEGFDSVRSQRPSNSEQEEQNSDDSDLFLKLAREEASTNNSSIRGPIRRSQIDRQSLPPSSSIFQSAISRRRGSDQESAPGSRPTDEPGTLSQALTYRPSGRDRMAPLDDINRSRHYGGSNSRSNPTTPRALGSREISPESQTSYGGRRPSAPDTVLPSRTNSYRQSNLSYSTPRTYNSSPLVSRTADIHDTSETPRGAEGTESTVSTTAPSTVWDELEDLKSRIHRLELTGKLPATSGAAISQASNERPPTATTTVTTMSSSPKRGRGNSISPIESVEAPQIDAHPLLHSALAKSKSLLSPEVYKALEITASDALSIAAMMGTSGQPGPISSSQSTVGGGPGVSDRQVRRKADSMCRSLTELCLALSEGRSEPAQPANNQVPVRPTIHDDQTITNIDPNKTQRQPISTDLTRVKSSPRALSRLEARRSSLLATSTLQSARYAPSEAGTPTQSSMAGRRTSLLLRSRRAGTEEPEEEDGSRFRAPSRATTEIGRTRNSPREYMSQQPMPDNRSSGIQSSLPVRRHYVSTSLTNGGPPVPALPSLGGRRYLDRSTPEKDTTSFVGRMADDRAQRKSSIGQGFPLGRTGSLTRRTRQPIGDSQGANQQGGYQ